MDDWNSRDLINVLREISYSINSDRDDVTSFSKLSQFLSTQYPGALDEYHKWVAVQRQINQANK